MEPQGCFETPEAFNVGCHCITSLVLDDALCNNIYLSPIERFCYRLLLLWPPDSLGCLLRVPGSCYNVHTWLRVLCCTVRTVRGPADACLGVPDSCYGDIWWWLGGF